ncbi:hypothetical protein ACS0TY_013218 [Phlomoides rotata]
MKEWVHISLVAIAAAILVLIILLILRRCFKRKPLNDAASDPERSRNLQNGIARLHQVSPHHLEQRNTSNKTNYQQLFKRGVSTKSAAAAAFSWVDHPSLITDAVENGWSRFAFTASTSSPPRSVLGACGAGDPGNDKIAEIGWEVCEGSADFLQKIRLNPNMMKMMAGSAASVIRTALPLPGPNLGNASFPQEAYFEITVLGFNGNGIDQFGAAAATAAEKKSEKWEGDKIKLIGEDFNAKNSPDLGSKIEKNEKSVLLCLGFTGGSSIPFRIPGTSPGSIGFNSTGSVFLDGTKHALDSENYEWGRTDKVVGCGYNPGQRKVFFTVDSQIVHEIHCRTEDFGSPMYPTLAANTDVTVLVNLGQSRFKFGPANLQRTPNPCFIGPLGNSPSLGYDDSRELFSMGRIDSQWMQRSATAARSNNNTVNSLKAIEYDQESEGDLFEIVLDSIGRSPYTSVHHQ